MIFLNDDDLKKVRLIDRALTSMSLEEVQQMFGEPTVVDVLNGTAPTTGVLEKFIAELNMVDTKLFSLRAEIREDMQKITKVASTLANPPMPYYPITGDLLSLKSKYGVY